VILFLAVPFELVAVSVVFKRKFGVGDNPVKVSLSKLKHLQQEKLIWPDFLAHGYLNEFFV